MKALPPLLALACLCAALPAVAAGDAPGCALEYRFVGRWDETPRRFEVELAFDAGARTATRLRLQREWGGITDFARAHRDLRAVSPGASIAVEADPGSWSVAHPAGGRVSVRYSVVNDLAQVDGEGVIPHRDFYRNAFGATWFQWFGHAVLVTPEHLPALDTVDACLRFEGLPPGVFASSLGTGQRDGVADLRVRASPQALRAAVYLGGDFRLLEREVGGQPVFVAMRGRWAFDDATFADATAAIVREHRRFWEDADFPRFLVSLRPNRHEHGRAGGTALTDAFAMHASRDFAVPGARFAHIIGHEHLHTWLPLRIGAMGEDEALRYWFSEGFTEYLAHRLLLRAGLWDLEAYGAELNRALVEYEASPARTLDNAGVLRAFWSDRAAQRIPYLRGELVAMHWSNALRERGGSLGAVLRGLRRGAADARDRTGKAPTDLAANRMLAALRMSLGESVDRDHAAFVEAGRPVPVTSEFLGPCFAGERVAVPRFELGFDAKSFAAGRVTGLVAGSAAEAAGLRDGMPLAGWSIHNDDAEKPAVIQVQEGGRVRDIRYVPRASIPLEVFQFRPRPGAVDDGACRRWIEAP